MLREEDRTKRSCCNSAQILSNLGSSLPSVFYEYGKRKRITVVSCFLLMKCVTRAEWKIVSSSCQMRNHNRQNEKIPKGTDVSNSKIHLLKKKKICRSIKKSSWHFFERHLNQNINRLTDCSRFEKRWIASNQYRSMYKMGIRSVTGWRCFFVWEKHVFLDSPAICTFPLSQLIFGWLY